MARKIWLALTLSNLVLPLYAGLNKDLNDFFDKFDASANVSSADIYNGQKAGYFTGGNVAIRSRIVDRNLARVNLPKFDAGCGGIDLFAGGFSFLNEDQLIQTMKSIGSSAIGYSFLLGLETVSPQVANTIKQLQTWANAINTFNINSCEAASQMVGSVWPKDTAANQQICRSLGGKQGYFADFASARHKCGQQEEFNRQMQNLSEKPEYEGLMVGEYNVAWEAIRKHEYLANNPDLAEFLMTLMGTVVVRMEDRTVVERWPSQLSDPMFLNRLLYGGGVTLYHCHNNEHTKCLHIQKQTEDIVMSKSWVGRVQTMLEAMKESILLDQEIPQDCEVALTKTRLPLYKIITVLAAYKKGHCPVDIAQVAEIVAMDLMLQYLQEATDLVREGAQSLRRSQMYADELDRYVEELAYVRDKIKHLETRNMQLLQQEMQVIQKVQMIEEQIAADVRL